jgi:ATP-dependent exoDNAse (exonuclease V) alpha subunit
MQSPTLDSLIDSVYPRINSSELPPPEYFKRRMILAARNGDVDAINNEILRRMPGQSKTYVSADSVVSEAGADGPDANANDIPIEFLHAMTVSGLPPGELTLKPGCPLILLRNLAPAQGLCNGTRMTLLRMADRVLEVRLLGGDHDGEIAFIPRITLTPSSSAGFTFILRRRQFPVRLAFALTINKSQGQSVEFVGLDLREPVFAHGQLYVALSQATSGRRVKVLLADNSDSSSPGSTDSTPNIVYPEVLLD